MPVETRGAHQCLPPSLSISVFWNPHLSLSLKHTVWVDWLTNETWEIPAWGWQVHDTMTRFYVGCQELCGPSSCTAATTPTEPAPLSTVCLSILMNYMLGCFLRTRSSVERGEPVKSRTYVTPVRPALQLQTKVFPMGSQDPPFRQGLGKQAVISASQFLPVNCERQEHW